MPGRRVAALLVATLLAGCQTVDTRRSLSVLDYLYPEGSAERDPQEVRLTLPLRVGVAFVPTGGGGARATSLGGGMTAGAGLDTFSEEHKRRLLERIAVAFEDGEVVGAVDLVPTAYLEPAGGYDNLDQIRKAFHLDLMVLLSYDQLQVSEATAWSATYLTVVGALVIEGEEHETHTVLDAVVVDLPSRNLLFRADGTSRVSAEMSAVDRPQALREAREEGLELAMDALVAHLQEAVAEFRRHAAAGTVRGIRTPALVVEEVVDAETGATRQVVSGAGAVGPLEAGLALLLLAVGARRRRHG